MEFKTTDLCDQYGDILCVMQDDLRSFGGNRRFHGPIATVRVYEDNVLVRQALETVPAGTILVVDGGGSRHCALLGDQLAEIAVVRGLAGVIINGCVRDAATLATMPVGILALGTNPLRSNKQGQGGQNITLGFAGMIWTPGAYGYVDEDGVVLAPHALDIAA